MSWLKKTFRYVAPVIPFVIPFAAPAIFAGLAGLAGVTTLSATTMALGSAAVGAGMGNLTAYATGGDRTRAGLYGAAAGGVGGYLKGPVAPTTSGQVLPTSVAPSSGTSGVGLNFSSPTAYTPTVAPPATFAGSSAPPLTLAGGTPVSTTVSTGAGSFPTLGYTGASTLPELSLVGGVPTLTGGAVAPASFTGAASATAGAAQPTLTERLQALPGKAWEGAKQIPGTVIDRASDPEVWADVILKAAGSLAGAYMAGPGTSPEEQAIIQQQADELRRLQETNMDLFRQRLEWAQAITGEARYFDPEYFGLQSARAAQQRGATAMREQTRGLSGNRREAEMRRGRLATARSVGTAFDEGYTRGAAGRLDALQTGVGLLPPSAPSTNYGELWNMYSDTAKRRRDAQADTGALISSITSPFLTQSRGNRNNKNEESEEENA